MESNADRLRAMYHRFWNQRDWRAGLDLFAEDVVWQGVEAIGLEGTRRGGREIGEFFREWLDAWDDYSNEAQIEEVTPDLILVVSRFRGRGKGSGIVVEMDVGQVYEFEGGKVVRQTMYRSPDEARRAVRELTERA